MPAPIPKESAISAFITREAGAIPRDVVAVDQPKIVGASTQASPTVVTIAATHGRRTGDQVVITGHAGSDNDAAVNDPAGHVVTVISPTTFSIPVDLTGAAGAGGGGTGGVLTSLAGFETGRLLAIFAAEDRGVTVDASVEPAAGPPANTETSDVTRGDNDSGFDVNGKLVIASTPTIPSKRRNDRIHAALTTLYGNRFEDIEVQFVGNPEA